MRTSPPEIVVATFLVSKPCFLYRQRKLGGGDPSKLRAAIQSSCGHVERLRYKQLESLRHIGCNSDVLHVTLVLHVFLRSHNCIRAVQRLAQVILLETAGNPDASTFVSGR